MSAAVAWGFVRQQPCKDNGKMAPGSWSLTQKHATGVAYVSNSALRMESSLLAKSGPFRTLPLLVSTGDYF